MSSSASLSWSFDADYLQACNCDYGCHASFPLLRHPVFARAQGRGDSKPADVGMCRSMALVWPPTREMNQPQRQWRD